MPKRVEVMLRRRALALQRQGKLRGDPDAYVYSTVRRIQEARKAKHG